jgi:hypothetical protein
MAVTDVRAHFEARAAAVAGCADLEIEDRDGYVSLVLRPRAEGAVPVVLHLSHEGDPLWAGFDEPVDPGIEFDDDASTHIEDIDFLIDLAEEGRVTAYRGPDRGIIEVRTDHGVHRSHYYQGIQLPRFGWKKRAQVVEYQPYR